MSEERGELKGMLIGLLVGAAVGTVLGLMIAPASGSETRHKLKNKLDEIEEKTKGTTARVKDFLRRKKEEIGEELETDA